MSKFIRIATLLHIIVVFGPEIVFSLHSVNSSQVTQRSSDGFYNANSVDRQYPFDASFLLPHLIVGVFIPIAVIIGIGVILMKLFIIGFMLVGRGGFGMGQNVGYYPWRADQQQQTSRSILGKDGSNIPDYLSPTLWSLIEKVSNALQKFEKYKN